MSVLIQRNAGRTGARRSVRTIVYASMPSPLGTLWIALGPDGVVRIDSDVNELEFVVGVESLGKSVVHDPDVVAGAAQELDEYFAGERKVFTLNVDLKNLRPFQQMVLREVMRVPYGSVQSYGGVARAIGKPGAGRAVGTAVATSPIGIVVPCHRIVRADGTLGEYAARTMGRAGRAVKLELLALEGYHAW